MYSNTQYIMSSDDVTIGFEHPPIHYEFLNGIVHLHLQNEFKFVLYIILLNLNNVHVIPLFIYYFTMGRGVMITKILNYIYIYICIATGWHN